MYPPKIVVGYSEWVNIFWEISTDRQIGMGIGPLPSTSIIIAGNDLDALEFDLFRFCMRQMDNKFLDHHNEDKVMTKTSERELSPSLFNSMFV